MSDLNEQLLPCAHCGGACQVSKGAATAEVWPHGTFYRVFCTICQVRQLFHRTESEALAAWNLRAPAAAPIVQPVGDETTPLYDLSADKDFAENFARLAEGIHHVKTRKLVIKAVKQAITAHGAAERERGRREARCISRGSSANEVTP